uniref:Uncharacterized protein n=1 Tax=Amphimedon queenslandica TaxID=400682 RepID=A0A1X7VKA2_AMPQE
MKKKKALRQSLKFRNYLIQLLREKVQNKVERVCSDPSLGDVRGTSTDASLETGTVALQHRPAKLRLNDTLAKFSGGNTEDEGAFPRWLRQVYLTPLTQPTVSVQPTNSDQPPTTARQQQTAGTTLNKFKTDMKDPQEYDVRVIDGSAAVKMRTAEDVTEVWINILTSQNVVIVEQVDQQIGGAKGGGVGGGGRLEIDGVKSSSQSLSSGRVSGSDF